MCSLVEGGLVTKNGQRQNPELRELDGSLRREVSTEEYLDIIRQIGEAGVKAVTLTGGEPTLRRDITALVAAIKKYPIHLSMISNGSGKPEIYREMIELGLDSLTISVDGTQEVHDHVRGRSGSFDRALRAIETVIAAKKTHPTNRPWLEVSCAISALNQHDLENLVDWFQSYDLDMLNLGYLHFSTDERQRDTERVVDGPVMHLKRSELPEAVVKVDTVELAERISRIKAARQEAGSGQVHAGPGHQSDPQAVHRPAFCLRRQVLPPVVGHSNRPVGADVSLLDRHSPGRRARTRLSGTVERRGVQEVPPADSREEAPAKVCNLLRSQRQELVEGTDSHPRATAPRKAQPGRAGTESGHWKLIPATASADGVTDNSNTNVSAVG